MNSEHFVILTGSKNNAGDFLIKHRAKKLFKHFRPDRKIIDFNRWEYLDDTKLNTINNSKALILLGGPAFDKYMYPGIYPLRENLDEIKVPIVTMGIGWYSKEGKWENTYSHELTSLTKKLLGKIEKSGLFSSVRDYQTLNALRFNGFKNYLMTGCPAYYDLEYIQQEPKFSNKIEKISFSLGVSFVESRSMEALMKENILQLHELFKNKSFEVVFHHSLDKEKILSTNSVSKKHIDKHLEFAQWLKEKSIPYVDISGSAESLIEYYQNCDLHIGYRVHAHIFMSSISKFSILISEDGRAKGVEKTIGGIVIPGYFNYNSNYGLMMRIANKFINIDRFTPNVHASHEIIENIHYEQQIGFIRQKNTRCTIDNNFNIMQKFLIQLP